MSDKKMVQDGIRAEKKVFDLAKEIAKKEGRSKNFILHRWLVNGMKIEVECDEANTM